MKTVYDEFIGLGEPLLAGCGQAQRDAVLAGIRSYLESLGLCGLTENADVLAAREWTRFEGASAESFCAFFETFDQRERIILHAGTCASMALERLQTGVPIGRRQYLFALEEHQKLAVALASDQRYASWLDGITEQITADLTFAEGRSDRIRHELALRALAVRKDGEEGPWD